MGKLHQSNVTVRRLYFWFDTILISKVLQRIEMNNAASCVLKQLNITCYPHPGRICVKSEHVGLLQPVCVCVVQQKPWFNPSWLSLHTVRKTHWTSWSCLSAALRRANVQTIWHWRRWKHTHTCGMANHMNGKGEWQSGLFSRRKGQCCYFWRLRERMTDITGEMCMRSIHWN